MKIVLPKPLISVGAMGIIISRFNEEITELLFQGARARLHELHIPEQLVTAVWVPGAVEIPLMAQKLAKSSAHFEAIICLGAVIRGETSHYDYVCEQVSSGCQRVALEQNTPVIFGVLTTETTEQALARAGGEHGNKGRDAVDAAIDMISLTKQLQQGFL